MRLNCIYVQMIKRPGIRMMSCSIAIIKVERTHFLVIACILYHAILMWCMLSVLFSFALDRKYRHFKSERLYVAAGGVHETIHLRICNWQLVIEIDPSKWLHNSPKIQEIHIVCHLPLRLLDLVRSDIWFPYSTRNIWYESQRAGHRDLYLACWFGGILKAMSTHLHVVL